MDILAPLKESVAQLAADVAAITEDYRAMEAMGSDIVKAVERRGHIEFSLFTPREGRP